MEKISKVVGEGKALNVSPEAMAAKKQQGVIITNKVISNLSKDGNLEINKTKVNIGSGDKEGMANAEGKVDREG